MYFLKNKLCSLVIAKYDKWGQQVRALSKMPRGYCRLYYSLVLLNINFLLACFQLSGDSDEKSHFIFQFQKHFMVYFDKLKERCELNEKKLGKGANIFKEEIPVLKQALMHYGFYE